MACVQEHCDELTQNTIQKFLQIARKTSEKSNNVWDECRSSFVKGSLNFAIIHQKFHRLNYQSARVDKERNNVFGFHPQ